MSETASQPERDENGFPVHPTDILINIIVALLTPMFLGCANANVELARMAAMETLNSYRARHQADLMVVAQIIAFGLATLGSLSLSMADDIDLKMVLRLRNNANALKRSEHRQRRVRAEIPPEHHAEPPQPQPQPQPEPQPQPQPQPQAVPAARPPQPQAEPRPDMSEQPRQKPQAAPPVDKDAAEAFAAFAAFIQASTEQFPNVAQRPPMGMRAAALASSATDLLTSIPGASQCAPHPVATAPTTP